MSAENKLGSSEYSEVVQVTTLEEVPSGPPLNVRAEAKSSTEITVVWEAPDREHWNGILLGYYVGYQISTSPEDKEVNPTQGFNFKTVEVRSHFGGETVLNNLKKYSQYHLIVQAYTSQGSGPPSKEIAVQTLEDVPAHFSTKTKQISVAKGKQVHVQCNVQGDNPIDIKWKIQSTQQILDESLDSRYTIREQVLDDGMVSELGISHTYRQDTGIYICHATNAFGQDNMSIQLIVQEVPEQPKNLRINSQQSRSLQLTWSQPFAGNSPIEEYHIFYKQISVPPKIMPIQAMTNMLREGMRAAISCQILEGDLPVSFRWERNGKPLIGTGNEQFRRLDEYSASLVIDHISSEHSGNYTCIASNKAGTETFTVPLTVNVPPKWILEPKDSSAQAGQDVYLHCQSDGYPKPTITWKKAIGTSPGEYKDFLYEPSVQLFPNGSIYFKKITKESQGHFLCEAKNTIGSELAKSYS
uniref:Down syndrome cell adhesion molecule-like protein Dscam2 n=1 Tax=Megaselia scalaris TaxID=36166 RepID=T1GFU6_MEGSC